MVANVNETREAERAAALTSTAARTGNRLYVGGPKAMYAIDCRVAGTGPPGTIFPGAW